MTDDRKAVLAWLVAQPIEAWFDTADVAKGSGVDPARAFDLLHRLENSGDVLSYEGGSGPFKVVERDPRIDPRPGDILSNGRCMVEVLEIDERGMIFCERYEPYLTRGDRVYRFQIALCYFRKGAAPSSVVVLAMGVPR